MPSFNRKGPLFMVAAAFFWSFGGLCIKFIPWGAMSIIGIRSLLAAAVFIVWRRREKLKFTPANIPAALCLSATMILFVFANKLTTAAAAIFLQFSAPIFIVLIQLIIYKKRPRPAEIAAMAATLLGMLLFFAGGFSGGGLLGNILAVCSGVTFAGVFVCNSREGANPEQSMLLGFFINTVICLPFVFFEVTAEPAAWAAVVFLGVAQVGLAYVFFSIGIKITPPLLACLTTAIEPVLNPVWVALAFGEEPGMFAVAGGAVIVLTVVGYNIWELKNPPKEAEPKGAAP